MTDTIHDHAMRYVGAELTKALAHKSEHGGSARSQTQAQVWRYVLNAVIQAGTVPASERAEPQDKRIEELRRAVDRLDDATLEVGEYFGRHAGDNDEYVRHREQMRREVENAFAALARTSPPAEPSMQERYEPKPESGPPPQAK